MDWNYGDVIDAVAEALPAETPLFIHGERRISWGEGNARMNNLARALIARGARPGDKLAFYLRNCPEYLEGVGAGFKARMVHVNINYRYKPEEVRYILDNSDAQALIYGSEFRDAVAQIRHELPNIGTFIEVAPDGEIASFAEDYETLAGHGDGERLDIRRTSDDMLFIYTGGTTGMPKGVMWRHGDLCDLWHSRVLRTTGIALPATIPAFAAAVKMMGGGMRIMPVCPLMHGTGFMTARRACRGGSVVTTTVPISIPMRLGCGVEHRVAEPGHRGRSVCAAAAQARSTRRRAVTTLVRDGDRSSGAMWTARSSAASSPICRKWRSPTASPRPKRWAWARR